jgi:TDP-4-amino-4,6-dideoxy-D-glucose deaminase
MELPLGFQDYHYLEKPLEIFVESLPSPRIKDLTVHVLGDLFLRPYLPSRELCSAFGISKDELKKMYLFIRSSTEVKGIFEFSPYHYLVKVLEHLSKDYDRTSRIMSGQTPFPLSETMELFISEACNAKCSFCYRDGKTYDKERVLSTQEYVNLINEFADLHGQNLDVSGGLEPLLSPSILDVLKAGLDRDLRVSLYTNGIALNNPGLVDCLMKIHKVRVSVSAYNRESYGEVMGVDKFDIVKSNLRNLVKAKKSCNSNVKIGCSFVVFKDNYEHIFEAIELARKLGIDFFDLRCVEATDLGDFDEKQRKGLASILEQIRKDITSRTFGKLNVSVADTFNVIIDPCNDSLSYIEKDLVNSLSYFRVNVTPYGNVYALNLIGQPSREDSRYLLGTVNEHNRLSDILQSRKIIPFEAESLLSHDITLISALSKLKQDLEFGIRLEENPFNWN